MVSEVDLSQARRNMLKQQIRCWDVLDQRLLTVMETIPREHFMPAEYRQLAYAEFGIPLGHDRTSIPPNELGKMLQAMHIKADDKILQVGVGMGYLTALLALLGGEVFVTDPNQELIDRALHRIATLPSNLEVNEKVHMSVDKFQLGDMIQHDLQAPYDVIILTGSVAKLPEAYKNALTVTGRIFYFCGNPPAMAATLLTRVGEDQWDASQLFETIRPRMENAAEAREFEF